MEDVTKSQAVDRIASDAESKSPLVLSVSIVTVYATNSVEVPLAAAESPQNASDESDESDESDASDVSDELYGSDRSYEPDESDSITKVNVPMRKDKHSSLNNDTVHYVEDGEEKKPKARIAREYFRDGKGWWIDESDYKGAKKRETDKDFDIGIFHSGDIVLFHPFLVKVIREVVTFFPGLRMNGDTIVIKKPHMPFFHFWDDMCKYAKSSSDPQKDIFAQLEKVAAQWVQPHHDKIRQQIREKVVEFDNLWALFCPGDLILTQDKLDQPLLHMYTACEERGKVGGDSGGPPEVFAMLMMFSAEGGLKRWCFDGWSISWNPTTREFGRQINCFAIDHFKGVKSIKSLDVYPLKYHDEEDPEANALTKALEERGYEWKKLVSSKPVSRQHQGPALSTEIGLFEDVEKTTKLDDRVICDHNGFHEYGSSEPGLAKAKEMMKPMLGFYGLMFKKGDRPIIESGYDLRYAIYDTHADNKEFSPLQALLCPSMINCLRMASKKWYQVSIANLSPVVWSTTAIDALVMEEKKKKIIRSLVEEHRKNSDKVIDDFIIGKGKGLVIVLHGPPGVGKTLTAESIAEATQKPLYPINIGELSVGKDVETRLAGIFKQASAWDAVLLLDEADVVLEARSFENSKRNGTVSVFLRMLEYYEGILIMTTNRMGIIDIAFQSRIHLAVKYDELTTDLRKEIWVHFLKTLRDKDKKVKVELLHRVDELAERPLNGRQIRNVLGIAQSMALSDTQHSRALTFEHVEDVIDQTLEFQDYFMQNQVAQGATLGQINPQWGKKAERRR